MAATSAARGGDRVVKIRSATNTLSSDNQSLIVDIRKTINTMQEIAVEMEKLNQTDKVKELEQAVVELLTAHDECSGFSNVMQSVGDNYQPGPQLTDFTKLFAAEKSKIKGNSTSNVQNNSLLRRFREAVWKVHHAGQPMPGEEQEDIVMTTSEVSLKNILCPITGKSVTELSAPVRSVDCKHIFEKGAILDYIRKGTKGNVCPVAGCRWGLAASKLVCDPLLPVEIEELRSLNKQTDAATVFEDFTALDDDDDDD